MSYDPSGRTLAEQAHAAGAVEPVTIVPNHLVELSFVVRGDLELAERIGFDTAAELALRDDVDQRVGVTVTERVAA